MLRRRTPGEQRERMARGAFVFTLAVIPLLAACGGGSTGGNAQAIAVTTPPSESQGVAVGKKPDKADTASAPAVKSSRAKGVGKQAKLPKRKVCPPGQAKKSAVRCTSKVATDPKGTPLTFPKPDSYSLPGINGTVWGFGPKDFHTAYSLPWYASVQQTIEPA